VGLMMPDGPDSQPIALVSKQIFQFLIGGMLLMLPHIALKRHGDGATGLQTMVLKGGLSVGLGYVLTQLPFVFLAESLNDLSNGGAVPPAVLTVGFAVMALLNATIMSGYFVLVWDQLRQDHQPLTLG